MPFATTTPSAFILHSGKITRFSRICFVPPSERITSDSFVFSQSKMSWWILTDLQVDLEGNGHIFLCAQAYLGLFISRAAQRGFVPAVPASTTEPLETKPLLCCWRRQQMLLTLSWCKERSEIIEWDYLTFNLISEYSRFLRIFATLRNSFGFT